MFELLYNFTKPNQEDISLVVFHTITRSRWRQIQERNSVSNQPEESYIQVKYVWRSWGIVISGINILSMNDYFTSKETLQAADKRKNQQIKNINRIETINK